MKLINGYHRITNAIKIFEYNLLFGKHFIHEKFSFRDGFHILVEKDGLLEIGNGCFFNNGCSITCMNHIIIGDNTIFGEDVKLYDHNYHINQSTIIKNSGHTLGEIKVGSNCWIGSNVVLLKGADIGDNSVIGASCIIASRIEEGSIVTVKGNYDVSKRIIKSSDM